MNKKLLLPEDSTPSARTAFLIATLIAIVHVIAAPYYLYLGWTSGTGQFNLLAAISFALGVLFAIGAMLSRGGQPTRGMILVLGILVVSYPPIATLASGLGSVLGLALTVAGPMIAFQVLRGRSAWVMTIVSIAAGLTTFLLDLLGSATRPSLPGIFIQLLAVSVLGVLGFSIVRQFRTYSLSTKLIGMVATAFILIAAVQFQISSVRARQQVEAQAQERLNGYYQAYVGRVAAESNAAGALASSIADRTDVQQLYLKNDREGLYTLLLPMFEDLKERQIVHLYIENPDGTVFLRVHNPEKFGDDVTYRGTAADALALKETTSGVEMGPNRMGVRGVSPMYSGNRFIGMVEVGLDFDDQFIADLKELTGADFTMWATYESASVPNLKPAEGVPGAPIEELFYYASTSPQMLPMDPELYRSILTTGEPAFQAVTENTSTPAIVYVTPLLGYKDKLFGLLEISFPYTETLGALQASRITSLGVVGGLAILGLILILIGTSEFVLKPINSLTQFASLQMSGDTHTRVRLTSGDEFERLANTFNSLANSVEDERRTLEQRVAERTYSLKLAAEVGRSVSQMRALDVMLKDAAEIIRSRFDLYYSQVYLTNPAQNALILQAGTGTVGTDLIRRGHRLPLDTGSINGRAALEKRSVVISDTGASATFKPNPLLPDTRSEMAVPLMVGDNVVGVLDMQSEKSGTLNQDILPAFEALAGQLAIAIQNAYLLAETEQTRLEVEKQAARLERSSWMDYLNAIDKPEQIGFVYDQNKIAPYAEVEPSQPSENSITVPITITGESLGTMVVELETDKQTNQTVELVNIVSRQVAQQIESIRLLENAERYRLRAEEASRRLTREGWQGYINSKSGAGFGYFYDLNEVKPSGRELPISPDKPVTEVPLMVHDEIVGNIAIVGLDAGDEGALNLVQVVTERLSAHLEGLRLAEQTEKRAFELEAVATISTAASATLDPIQLLQSVVDLTKERFNLYHAHVYLLNESSEALDLAAGAGEVGRQMVAEGWNIPIDHEHSIVARAARSRQSVISNDIIRDTDSQFLSNRLLPDTRSEMAVPLIVGDTVLGVFDVQADTPGRFTEDDIRIQTTLAAQVSVAVQNARTLVKAQHQAERESTLNTISQKIQSATTVEAVLQIAARELGHALGAPMTMAQLSLKNQS